LEFEARRRELRLRENEAGQAQDEDRGFSPADPEVSNVRDVASIGRSGEEAERIGEETGSAAEPIGASLTPKPRFDRKANHRRYMREWRRRRRRKS
jgi:hypothetical protein